MRFQKKQQSFVRLYPILFQEPKRLWRDMFTEHDLTIKETIASVALAGKHTNGEIRKFLYRCCCWE